MPKAGSYRANSVIYFQGDKSDKVYVLQAGRISLNYSDIESGKDIREVIQTGEFFGVKSALGRYPREETALVLADAQVLVFTVPEFEVFAQANSRIIMKMLKVFSNQLRRVHKQVENLLEKSETTSPEYGLYKAGEYYLKNRQYSQAKYVFGRYLTYYPAGRLAENASRHLEASESGLTRYGDGKGPAPIIADAARPGSSWMGADEPRDEPTRIEERGPAPGGSAPRRSGGGEAELSDTAKKYYDAVSLFTSEHYREALTGFKRIIEAGSDPEYVAKALFDIGRSLFMLQQYDLCIKHLTQVVQTNPRHPDLIDMLFYLGQAYERKGDRERAAGIFKKILVMEQDEDSSMRIKAKRALRQMEEGSNG